MLHQTLLKYFLLATGFQDQFLVTFSGQHWTFIVFSRLPSQSHVLRWQPWTLLPCPHPIKMFHYLDDYSGLNEMPPGCLVPSWCHCWEKCGFDGESVSLWRALGFKSLLTFPVLFLYTLCCGYRWELLASDSRCHACLLLCPDICILALWNLKPK